MINGHHLPFFLSDSVFRTKSSVCPRPEHWLTISKRTFHLRSLYCSQRELQAGEAKLRLFLLQLCPPFAGVMDERENY